MMQIRSDIPRSLAEVDTNFLNDALRHAGLLEEGSAVASFETQIIGEGAGFLGEVVRISLTYTEDTAATVGAPDSIIMKIPTALKNRSLGQMMGVYEREIRFYTVLQDRLGIRTPRMYFAALDVLDDAAQGLKILRFLNRLPMWLLKLVFAIGNWVQGRTQRKYVLLIEDLGRFRVGDQVVGCNGQEARFALNAMAKMHARYWNSIELEQYPWIVPMEDSSKLVQLMYLQGLPALLAAKRESMTDNQLAVLEWLRVNGARFIEEVSQAPFTLLHGDFRPDNLCFDEDEVVLFDWQTLMSGPPGMELAYFLSAAIDVDVPEAEVLALVDYYGERLREGGATISQELLHWQYKVGMVVLFHRIAPAQYQDVLDLGEDRGQELMLIWVDRILAKLGEMDVETLMASRPG